MTQVLLGNPGRQHSDQLALALQEAELLDQYLHGGPIRPELVGTLERVRDKRLLRFRVALALIPRLAPYRLRATMAHGVYEMFDACLARHVNASRQRGVIAYESSALSTFQRAKVAGLITILDAASLHHQWQELGELSDAIRGRNRRKDAEIALADHVLTCSSLARESYIAAGVDPERCHVAGFGVDLEAFTPAGSERLPGPTRFLFVGKVSRQKGADVLFAACEILQSRGVSFEVECIGEVEPDMAKAVPQSVRLKGRIAYSELPARYRGADCFVHASRFDSFASVVAEAMACGIPAIVSDRTGARDMIRQGETGWVLPTGDPAALADCMAEFADDLSTGRKMSQACRNEATHWTWQAYRKRAARLLEKLLATDKR